MTISSCTPKIKTFFFIAIDDLQQIKRENYDLWIQIRGHEKEIALFPFGFVGSWATVENCYSLQLKYQSYDTRSGKLPFILQSVTTDPHMKHNFEAHDVRV